jgi:UDP-glucose 4-epimerase
MDIDPEFNYTGGRRGWSGDVPEMHLDISRLENDSDWESSTGSEKAIRSTVSEYADDEPNS